MLSTSELMRYVDESNAWLNKVRQARKDYDAGIITMEKYVATMDACDSFMAMMAMEIA